MPNDQTTAKWPHTDRLKIDDWCITCGALPGDRCKTIARRCACCGEKFYGHHNCDKAREARALWEAAKRANDPDSRRALGLLAYQAVEEAENGN